MRITFESVQEHNIQSRGGAERMHAPVRDEVKKQERAGAYSVNIGAQDARAQRDGTYKKENMTAEEVSLQAEQINIRNCIWRLCQIPCLRMNFMKCWKRAFM